MQIGSLSAQPAQPLPDDLRSICDSAKQGVVFVSLGTTSIQGEPAAHFRTQHTCIMSLHSLSAAHAWALT